MSSPQSAKATLEMACNALYVRKQELADAMSEHARAMVRELQAHQAFDTALVAYQESIDKMEG
jgi:hypothetical protein